MAWDEQHPHIINAQKSRCDWDETANPEGSGKCTKYGNECGWRKVRHIPGGSTAWYTVPNGDKLTGAEVWGNSNDDTASWGVKFDDDTTFDQFMFQTNDKEDWAIFNKADITGTHDGDTITAVDNSKGAVGNSFKIWNRAGYDTDPIIKWTNGDTLVAHMSCNELLSGDGTGYRGC